MGEKYQWGEDQFEHINSLIEYDESRKEVLREVGIYPRFMLINHGLHLVSSIELAVQ